MSTQLSGATNFTSGEGKCDAPFFWAGWSVVAPYDFVTAMFCGPMAG
jgi:hypothetical protein